MRGELAMHGADVFGLGVTLGQEGLDRRGKCVLVTDPLGGLQSPGGDCLQVVRRW
jgi:hypothetical protein